MQILAAVTKVMHRINAALTILLSGVRYGTVLFIDHGILAIYRSINKNNYGIYIRLVAYRYLCWQFNLFCTH